MGGSQEREHYWCGEQSVGAWQMMAEEPFTSAGSRRTAIGVLYVMLSTRQGGLLKMVVRVHDAVVSFFSNSTRCLWP